MSDNRLANEAWESLLRAQVVLMRRFAADDLWTEVGQREHDVLYTLSKAEGGLNMVEIHRDVLMTQPGLSRLVSRLEERGLLQRSGIPEDRRVRRLVLTAEGRRLQRSVGRQHARAVAEVMTSSLSREQLAPLRDLAQRVTAAAGPANKTAEEDGG